MYKTQKNNIMKYFKRKSANSLKIILLFLLTPMIGVYFFPEMTKKDKNHINDLSKKYGMESTEYVALKYEARTNRDLFTDTIISALIIGLIASYIIIQSVIYKHT
jgi:hypothetical protein